MCKEMERDEFRELLDFRKKGCINQVLPLTAPVPPAIPRIIGFDIVLTIVPDRHIYFEIIRVCFFCEMEWINQQPAFDQLLMQVMMSSDGFFVGQFGLYANELDGN